MTYLTPAQVEQLLRPINGSRVATLDGLSHLEAYDVRAHLIRIFGFGRWSGDVVSMDLLYEEPTQTKAGKPAFKVAYRCTYRLRVNAPDGTHLASYTEAAVGESTMPDFKRGDAHDMAIKTAESQAFKRCAVNLGDQYGLSLYQKGSTGALVKGVMHGFTGPVTSKPVDHEASPVTPEAVPDEDPDLAAADSALDDFTAKAHALGNDPKQKGAAVKLTQLIAQGSPMMTLETCDHHGTVMPVAEVLSRLTALVSR